MKKIISFMLVFAMLFTAIPVAFAADIEYTVQTGDSSYAVQKGESIDVPVYITAAAGDGTMIGMAMLEIATPTGFTAAIKGGTGKTGANVTATNKVKVAVNQAFAASSTDPFIVVTYTATDSAENAELKIAGVKLSDADLGKIDSSKVEVKGATITVTGGSTPVVLDSISVNPTALTVPYANQSDIAGYVKNNVVVTANYSDASTKTVTDYTVDVAGTTATIAYEGKKATVTLTLEPAPTTTDYTVKTGDETYTVEKGKSVDVSVYITAAAGDGTMIGMAMLEIATPTGFTAAIKGGTGKTGANVTATNKVKVAVNQAFAASSTDPFIVVTYTATDSAENAELKIAGVKLSDADLGKIDSSKVEVKGATITVTGGSTPSEPTLTGISVNPDEVMVPYNQNVTQVIGTTNFSVTAFYDDETSKVLDRLEYDIKISDDGNTATVSYKGKTAAINIKYQPTPVLTVEKSEITVPYGTEDVEAYVKAEIKSGKVKLDETDLTFDDYVIEFTNGADTATVKYAKDETITATVSVKYVELDKINVVIKGDSTEVKIPWDSTDDVTAVKALITVTAVFTNGAHDNEITNYTVDFGEGTFTVSYGGLTSEPIPYSKDAKPEAKVTGIKAEPTELNVPYANTVSNDEIIKFVKANVKVTATYDDESTSDVAEYGVTIADDKATITYEGFTADVTLVKETRKLELSNTEITVDEGTDKDGITAYVKANVTAKYVYSQTTAEQTIPADELAITVNDELTEVTVEVGGESAKIAVNIKVVPNFIETVKADTNAYGIATAKLVIFTDVKDGKVVKVTDEKGTYDAIYMGNGKWAAVVTGSHTAFADNGSLPEAAKFGRLHDASMITAYDALLTLLKANNGAVNVFDNDYQKYLLADVNGDGTLTADEALYINRISLGNADESTLWFNK